MNATPNAIMPALVISYTNAIYMLGTRRFTARDGYSGIPAAYHEPVKQYAAANLDITYIDNALAQTWLTQTEYDETVAYII